MSEYWEYKVLVIYFSVLLHCVSVLDRLQSFLPQMAEANEKLKQQMEEAPAGRFDIESVEEAERVIEMVIIIVPRNIQWSVLVTVWI